MHYIYKDTSNDKVIIAMPQKKQKEERKTIAVNRKARHDYAVLETYEAGISLTGTEVKSCRAGGVTLSDSYACILNGQLRLINTHIALYDQGNIFNHEPKRQRTLLMHKREILRLKKSIEAKGLTLIPLAMYFSPKSKVKVELGLCRGKNTIDKREDMKKRMDELDMKRSMKR